MVSGSFQTKMWTLLIQRNFKIPGIRWSKVFDNLKEISIGRMDFDNSKEYGDTSFSDGLVRMWNTQNTTSCPCTIALYVRKHYINSNMMIFAFYVRTYTDLVFGKDDWVSKCEIFSLVNSSSCKSWKFYFQSHLSWTFHRVIQYQTKQFEKRRNCAFLHCANSPLKLNTWGCETKILLKDI